MGIKAEETTVDETPEQISAREAKEAAEKEAQAELDAEESAKREADAEKSKQDLRKKLESEGKTEDEIEAALKSEDEPGEVEIVREGTQPQKKFTQQQVDDIVSKRVKRLNGKVEDVTDTSTATKTELELERERNKVLALALEQAKQDRAEEVKKPDPNDFEDGYLDPKFLEAQEKYTDHMISKKVSEQVTKLTESANVENSQAQNSEALLKKQEKHYTRAQEIGAKDYEEVEDQALQVLGNEVANEIINNFDDSHVILYYLGKNPQEASRISNLLKTQPIKGVAEVGRLSAELKIKPKTKQIVSDPDEEINGDGSADVSAIERKLDKLREAASSGSSEAMKKLIEFKRKNKAVLT